jgi:16S rRNA (cytidine1402-2'-O)-methyltransferase
MIPAIIRILPIFHECLPVMSNKGKLYLIPNMIAEESFHKITTTELRVVLSQLQEFLVENVRTARRYLSSLKIYESVETLRFNVLDKDTDAATLPSLMKPLFEGIDIGVISEAGCPGIADPGAIAVAYAHEHEIQVVPLVGPSSILLALMASGLNGQNFAFHGYLPVEKDRATIAIKNFEKESRTRRQTQIFIETPYRNQAILEMLLKNLLPDTLLTIAIDLTGKNEKVHTKPVKKWRQHPVSLPKMPAVFLFQA